MDLLYSIAQAGSGARAHYRLAGWAGWLAGWLAGLQSAVCSVPEDSVPFGRGPAGCGAAANYGPSPPKKKVFFFLLPETPVNRNGNPY